jgi:hypothetical protein
MRLRGGAPTRHLYSKRAVSTQEPLQCARPRRRAPNTDAPGPRGFSLSLSNTDAPCARRRLRKFTGPAAAHLSAPHHPTSPPAQAHSGLCSACTAPAVSLRMPRKIWEKRGRGVGPSAGVGSLTHCEPPAPCPPPARTHQRAGHLVAEEPEVLACGTARKISRGQDVAHTLAHARQTTAAPTRTHPTRASQAGTTRGRLRPTRSPPPPARPS